MGGHFTGAFYVSLRAFYGRPTPAFYSILRAFYETGGKHFTVYTHL